MYNNKIAEEVRKKAKVYWKKTFFHPKHSLDTTTVLKMKDDELLRKIQEILDYREKLYEYGKNMSWDKLKGNVLDFGCGSCPDGHYFLKNKLIEHLTIADIVPSNIIISLRHLSLISGSITTFLWEKTDDLDCLSNFDIIYSGGVLHHIPDAKMIIDKLKLHLKRDGFFLIMLYTHKLYQCEKIYLEKIPSTVEGAYCRGYDLKEVKELFGDDMYISEVKTFYDEKYCKYIIRWK